MKSVTIVVALLIMLAVVGWVSNVVKIFFLDFASPYKAEIIRVIGVPVPIVGSIAGYMDIGEENER